MRLSGAKKVHYDSGPNMTPLVDVVMVILIFLMLAGSFGGAEHYLASSIPLSSKGAGQHKNAFDEDVIIDVRVDSAPGSVNAWVAKFGDVRTSSPSDLKNALESKLKQYQANGTSLDKLQVIINPNRLVKWRSLIAVYGAASDAGYKKIAFSQAH